MYYVLLLYRVLTGNRASNLFVYFISHKGNWSRVEDYNIGAQILIKNMYIKLSWNLKLAINLRNWKLTFNYLRMRYDFSCFDINFYECIKWMYFNDKIFISYVGWAVWSTCIRNLVDPSECLLGLLQKISFLFRWKSSLYIHDAPTNTRFSINLGWINKM